MRNRFVIISVILSLTLTTTTAQISSAAKIEISEHLQLIPDLG